MRINRRSVAAISLVAGIALSQSSGGAASAAEIPTSVSFVETTLSVEYGQYWSFPVAADNQFLYEIYQAGQYQVTTTATPGSYAPVLTVYPTGSSVTGSLSAPYEGAPLGAGTYTFGVSGSVVDGSDTYTAQTPAPATLTVQKAKLGMELRVLADPLNEASAIVTAKFTGRFVDEYQSSFFPASAVSPAGVWHITLTDDTGEVALERNIERSAGSDVLATSFYWSDAEPGMTYVASAEFAGTGASANNFTISSAQDFDYTAPEVQRPVPTSSASAKPDASLPEATEFGLPLWAIVLAIVLIVALTALVTVLSVRLSRRSVSPDGKVAE